MVEKMGVRKKGRARFQHSGREFVWWIDNAFIRVVSDDKLFAVAFQIYDTPSHVSGLLRVNGPGFPGLISGGKRPCCVVVPQDVCDKLQLSMGAFVDELLSWCLDPERVLQMYPA